MGLSISDDQVVELAELFHILGEPSRLKMVLVCLSEPRCVSDIASHVHLSQSLVSHHLRLLRAGRILRTDRRGKQVFYTPADEHIRRVLGDMVAHVVEPLPEMGDAD